MVRRRQTEELTDMTDEEEPIDTVTEEVPVAKSATKSAKKNGALGTRLPHPELSYNSPEEADEGVRLGIKYFERYHNYNAIQNLSRTPENQKTPIALDINYRRKPLVRDGKVVTDAAGVVQYEEPSMNMQVRLPIVPEAISLPLNEAIYLPTD